MPSRVDVRNTQTGQGGGKEALAGSTTAAQYMPRLGSTSGPEHAQQRFGESVVLASDRRVTSQAEATAVSRAEMERHPVGAVSGKGSCIGNPELVSRTVIELQRLGKRFSGLYYVTSTTHTINARGYTTEFDAKRERPMSLLDLLGIGTQPQDEKPGRIYGVVTGLTVANFGPGPPGPREGALPLAGRAARGHRPHRGPGASRTQLLGTHGNPDGRQQARHLLRPRPR